MPTVFCPFLCFLAEYIPFFFEVIRKVAEIIVSAHLAYLKNRAFCISEKPFRLFYSVKYQITVQSSAERGFHKSVQMIRVLSENLWEPCIRYILIEMFLYIKENFINFFVCFHTGDFDAQKLCKNFTKRKRYEILLWKKAKNRRFQIVIIF